MTIARCWAHRRRGMFGIGLAFVSATALIAWLVYRQQQREQVIADIRQLGGHYAEGAPSFPGWADKPRAVIGDRVLAPFAKPSEYKLADLWFKPFTDADLARLSVLTDLTQLDLCGTHVTDRGLASIKKLTRLESLELACTRVTDAGLVHLRGMAQLSRLRLEQCDITDAGVPHLQAIPSPEMYVHLQETKVTTVKAGELRVRPIASGGELRVGQILLIQGSCTLADPNYELDEICIDMLGNEEGSDEAAHFGNGSCRPTRRAACCFDFEIRLPAPRRPGVFKVEATTFARMQGLRAFYTAGVTRIRVLPKDL